ncbi:MAG TPA: IS1595 family transposase [Candidatus Absconditabacterales bacterium]|nr:IS1595 family transposase [Candidatus Absconditabacterales bacterium]HNG97354.1 IS1595 family transposase [Candidatus Absconditabacterales bacterium]
MLVRNSKISDYIIKKIIKHFVVDIEASKCSELINVNRNTINRYYNLFRSLIYEYQVAEFEKIKGSIEIDESYWGAKRKRGYRGKLKRGRGTLKQPVFGLLKRGGRVYTEIVPNCKAETLVAIIEDKIDKVETEVYSDMRKSYDGLVAIGYDKHYRVNHSDNEFSKGEGVHINGIENFRSFSKGRLAKFRGVKINFEKHLKECERRYKKTNNQMIQELINLLKAHLKTI